MLTTRAGDLSLPVKLRCRVWLCALSWVRCVNRVVLSVGRPQPSLAGTDVLWVSTGISCPGRHEENGNTCGAVLLLLRGCVDAT